MNWPPGFSARDRSIFEAVDVPTTHGVSRTVAVALVDGVTRGGQASSAGGSSPGGISRDGHDRQSGGSKPGKSSHHGTAQARLRAASDGTIF